MCTLLSLVLIIVLGLIEILSIFFPLLKFGHCQSSQHNLEVIGFDNDTVFIF